MDYFNGTDAHCGGAVGAMGSYVYNLTSSYADQKNEVNIVATSLAMLLLAALLLAFDLLAGAATLRPAARLVLSVSLALFLPVTSYLFSEAKNDMLPDDVDCTARVYGAMTTELKRELGLKGYYFSTDATRYGKMMAIAGGQEDDDESAAEETTVVRKGARLGKALMDEAAGGDEAAVWKLVADVWTEIVVYVAPARDAEQVRAHGEALARGGEEFVTVLWALVTHTGIARPAASSV
uniref:DUF4220 domain-containing protein n=1 Tax=Oryza nivara TaxID=4536 RepID=A0A0E0G569_ORYNI